MVPQSGPAGGNGLGGDSAAGSGGTGVGGTGIGGGMITGGNVAAGGIAGGGTAGAFAGAGGAAGSGGSGSQDAASDNGGDAKTLEGGIEAGTPSHRFACPPGPFPTPLAGAAQAVCGNFNFKYNWNEGPTWIASENAFYFSNYLSGAAGPGDIIKYTPGGQCETFIADVGCNGLTAAYDGNIIAACQTPRAVVEYDLATKQPKILAGMYMGQLLDSPNDIVAHSNGGVYFTNPTYELGGRPQGVGPAIFRILPTGALQLITKVNGQPNGIALSPDERRLYVVGGGAWDLDSNGVPSNQSSTFPLDADGLSVDCAGNVYLSGGQIIGPNGNQVATFPGGTMAAFGGADNKTLIVVGSGTALHVVPMNLPGPAH